MWIAISVVLMVAGLVGMIVCQKKQKTNPNAQALAFVFLVLILAGAGTMLWKTGMFGGDPEMDRIISNEVTYTKARSKAVADYAGKTWAGNKAVIITDPNAAQSPISKASVDSMSEYLKAAGIEVLAVEALKVPENAAEGPAENYITAKLFNDIFAQYKDAGLYVIMSQMPIQGKELKNMKCWSFNNKKQNIIITSGDIMNLKNLIAAGKIGAAVAMNGSRDAFDPEKAAPSDPNAAFAARYVLITPKNVNEVAAKYKDIFAR